MCNSYFSKGSHVMPSFYICKGEGFIKSFMYSVIDVSTQIRDLYNRIFVTPTKEISAILAAVYKNMKRTSKSTLNTIWVGINDIDLTYNWEDTNALDNRIMERYELLLVSF